MGLAASLLRLDFPVLIDKTINNVASMATPLALITLGAGFEGKKALAKIKPTLVAAFIKLVAQAAVFIPVAIHFGFTGEKLIAIMVMLSGAGNAELLYHGKEHEKRRCADRKYHRGRQPCLRHLR